MKKMRNLIRAFTLAAGMSLLSGQASPAAPPALSPDPVIVSAGISPDTGKNMQTTGADAPGTYTFERAKSYCANLKVSGHEDWRVPTTDELNVLFNNRATIGGFNVTGAHPAGWYWSASEDGEWNAWSQRFSDGGRNHYAKDFHLSVRCVR